MTDKQPLVSVGIPSYNRPSGLKVTLDSIINQTYKNFEIIVSDNCSTDPEVVSVVQQYAGFDKRIKFYQMESNKGPYKNFQFLCDNSHGKYFMWAADDDRWRDYFIEGLVDQLESLGECFVAAGYEAQYVGENYEKFDFFPEGTPFYSYQSDSSSDRVSYMLENNYGNLFYSMYRLDVLQKMPNLLTTNEIPFLLQIASSGNWKVLPEIGFFKSTKEDTYIQAKWERCGGKLDAQFSLRNLRYSFVYHINALAKIFNSIQHINISPGNKLGLKALTTRLFLCHFISLAIGYKRPNRADE